MKIETYIDSLISYGMNCGLTEPEDHRVVSVQDLMRRSQGDALRCGAPEPVVLDLSLPCSDFDGDGGIIGCADASEVINLTRRLRAEGFTEQEIEKLWGGNFLRVMREVQSYNS